MRGTRPGRPGLQARPAQARCLHRLTGKLRDADSVSGRRHNRQGRNSSDNGRLLNDGRRSDLTVRALIHGLWPMACGLWPIGRRGVLSRLLYFGAFRIGGPGLVLVEEGSEGISLALLPAPRGWPSGGWLRGQCLCGCCAFWCHFQTVEFELELELDWRYCCANARTFFT